MCRGVGDGHGAARRVLAMGVVVKTQVRYPLSALLAITGPMTAAEYARRTGLCRRVAQRHLSTGTVPDSSADQVAIGVGSHPGVLWDAWWQWETPQARNTARAKRRRAASDA